ncbi:gamma-glutamylcyclotransferase [Paraburkholderia dipogonis]|uniref:gamma-glutamylcyclotransferase n=1 Tax=Paraburkholderia dipogonis TaxID=1211383 RepID=UPI0038BC5DE2
MDDRTETNALAFVVDEVCEQFELDSLVATVAPLIGTATRKFGSNTEYPLKLREALIECALQDSYIEELASEIERLPRRAYSDVTGAFE